MDRLKINNTSRGQIQEYENLKKNLFVFDLLLRVVNKFPDWIFRARTECGYHTSR